MSYNGCANWETWTFKLYFLDDMSEEETAERFKGMNADEIANALQSELDQYLDEVNAHGIIKEFINESIRQIDFNELADDISEIIERVQFEEEREQAIEEARDMSNANEYRLMKERQQREYNEFSAKNTFFAFSDKQFDEGMQKLGLEPTDTSEIYSIGAGGYILRTESKAMNELFEKFENELREAINADESGDGFIYDMFRYELANHEYCITFEKEDAINATGLTEDEVYASEKLLHGLNKAARDYLDYHYKYGELAG